MFGKLVGDIAGTAVAAVIGGLIKGLFGWFAARRQRADAIGFGQQRQVNVQHQAAAEATRRMQGRCAAA